MERWWNKGARAPIASFVALLFASCSGVKDLPPVLGSLAAQHLILRALSNDAGVVYVGQTKDLPFTIENGSPMELTLENLSVTLVNSTANFSVITDDCSGQTLSPDESCELLIRFAPSESRGGQTADNASLRVQFQVAGNPAVTVEYPVKGTARRRASLTVTGPSSMGQALVGAGASSVSYTITNEGEEIARLLEGLTINNQSPGIGTFSRAPGGCGTTVAPGESCTITIDASLLARGEAAANLVLPYHDGMGNEARSWSLAASARLPADIARTSGDPILGQFAVNSAMNRTFTVTNPGDRDATGLSIGASGGLTILSQDCGTTLASGDSCDVTVRALYSEAGEKTGTISFQFQNGASAVAVSRTITTQATVLSRGSIAFFSGSPAAQITSLGFGAIVTEPSPVPTRSVRIKNPGAREVTGVGVTLAGATNGLTLSSNGCTETTLAPGAYCDVTLSASPTTGGPIGGSLLVTYAAEGESHSASLPVQGSASTPASLSALPPASVALGDVPTGETLPARTVSIRNFGGVAAESLLVSIETVAGSPFVVRSTTCNGSLAPSATCAVEVGFSSQTEGPAQGVLTVGYSNGRGAGTPVTVPLTASAKSPASLEIAVDSANPDFGDVIIGTQSSARFFTLRNLGNLPADIAALPLIPPSTANAGSFTASLLGCADPLPAGAECSIQVRATPQAPSGLQTLNGIRVPYDPGTGRTAYSNPLVVSVNARQRAGFQVASRPSFPPTTVGRSSEGTLVLTHTGDVAASSLSIGTVTEPFSSSAQLPFSVGPAPAPTSLSVPMTFTPRASDAVGTGEVSGGISIRYFDGVEMRSLSVLAITAIAKRPAQLALVPPAGRSFDYGTVVIGSGAANNPELPVELVNTGGTRATAVDFGSLLSPFGYKTTPALTPTGELAPGGRYQFTVKLTTNGLSADQNAQDTLRVTYDDGGILSSASVSQALSARIVEPASLTADPATVAFGDVVRDTVSATRSIVLRNTKSGRATLGTPSNLGSFRVAGGDCSVGRVLESQQTCTLLLEFRPTSFGNVSTTISIPYDSGAGSRNVSIAASGYGMTPASLALYTEDGERLASGAQSYLGEVPVGHLKVASYVLVNEGEGPASSLSAGALSSPFAAFPGIPPFSGTNGTCGSSLPGTRSGQDTSCLIPVEFKPTVVAMGQSAVYSIFYSTGRSTVPAPLAVTFVADGLAPRASISLSSTAAEHYLVSTPVNCPAAADDAFTERFVYTNNGQREATSFQVGVSGPYRIVSSNCGSELGAPGGSVPSSCTLRVAFEPTAHLAVAQQGFLTATYHDGLETKTVSLKLLARSNSAASLVPSFSLCGVRPQGFETMPESLASDLDVDASGRLVIAGTAQFSSGASGFVARFDANGRPDPTFTSGTEPGVVMLPGLEAFSIAAHSDGSLFVGVRRAVPGGGFLMGVVKVKASGEPYDPTFAGGSGIAMDEGTVVPDGQPVRLIEEEGATYLVSRVPNGARVTRFDASGVFLWGRELGRPAEVWIPRDAVLVGGAQGILVLADHEGVKESFVQQIAASGEVPGAPLVAKFGNYAANEAHAATALALTPASSPESRLYVVGTKGPVYAVAAYHFPARAPVTTFGTDGVATFAPRALNSSPSAVTMPDGTLVTVGNTAVGTQTDLAWVHWGFSGAATMGGTRLIDGYSSADYQARLVRASGPAGPELVTLGATWEPNRRKFLTYLVKLAATF